MSRTPAELSRDRKDRILRGPPPPTDPRPPPRISGDAAFDKDILGSVSEQIQKNFARNHWKVGVGEGPVDLAQGCPPRGCPIPQPQGEWSVLTSRSWDQRRGLTSLSSCSEHSMPPPSCATSASWGRAQRVRRPRGGGWPATATPASRLASSLSGDTQVRGGGPCPPWSWRLSELRGWQARLEGWEQRAQTRGAWVPGGAGVSPGGGRPRVKTQWVPLLRALAGAGGAGQAGAPADRPPSLCFSPAQADAEADGIDPHSLPMDPSVPPSPPAHGAGLCARV